MNINKRSVTIMLKIVGTSCNMKCKYCYEHVQNNIKIGITDVVEVFNYLKEFMYYESVFIVFHGGEPLLSSQKTIISILSYIKKNFIGNWNVQFQTNGTLLNDSWVDIFKKYLPNVSLSISLDPIGCSDLRILEGNDYRKIIISNIKKYINEIANIGIISVAHSYNLNFFPEFIEELIKLGISNLTINKYITNVLDSKYYISEMQYVYLLKSIFLKWVKEKWYTSISIQPLVSLFSDSKNKICSFLPDDNKCTYFRTFYNKNQYFNFCDHILDGIIPKISNKCLECDIYNKCGGGCLAELKDSLFCKARRELFQFIEEVKNGS